MRLLVYITLTFIYFKGTFLRLDFHSRHKIMTRNIIKHCHFKVLNFPCSHPSANYLICFFVSQYVLAVNYVQKFIMQFKILKNIDVLCLFIFYVKTDYL